MKVLYKLDIETQLDIIDYNAIDEDEFELSQNHFFEDGIIEEINFDAIKRYKIIVDRIKQLENNKCQIESCAFTFRKKNGLGYSEAHHLVPLSKGGTQAESNIIVLCSNHHRMLHYANCDIVMSGNYVSEIIINNVNYKIRYSEKRVRNINTKRQLTSASQT